MRKRRSPYFVDSKGVGFLSFIILTLLTSSGVKASYCGSYAVPFSIEILNDGLPVLGCAQPSCIAEPAEDYDDSSFITDNKGITDGFLR
ncbi:hypothetical protein WR25_24010 [Diploscapter pachys]|uniref:Uncharacterized protein n=1 Tax=Diploscapter pachys TaxID=2018661 RepID=A0A2A2KV49_9BILA|nr:hypothetical protein WR25_24010 [Diploscapter pachys]